MHVTIRLFARLRELAGAAELTRQLPDGATAKDAWKALAAEFPALTDYAPSVSCAVNEEVRAVDGAAARRRRSRVPAPGLGWMSDEARMTGLRTHELRTEL